MKITIAAVSLWLCGCAGLVTANDGQMVTIEHDGFVSVDSARDVALRACQQNGKRDAVYARSANKNPRLEPGSGVQLSTYQCR